MVTTATNYDDMRPIKPDKLDWEVCRTLGVHSMADGGRWTCSLCDWFTPARPPHTNVVDAAR